MSVIEGIKDIMEKLRLCDTMGEKEFFEAEISRWKGSCQRRAMIDGERYYRGDHDILKSVREVIGRDGKLKRVDNLPNNRIVDNQYQRLVNQKINYLMGREFLIDGDNGEYIPILRKMLGRDFQKILKCVMRDAVNMGIGWLYVYTDEDNKLKFKRIPAFEVIPYWKDYEHTLLDKAVRIYTVEGYKGMKECVREMVEIYSADKVEVYELEGGKLLKEEEHFYIEGDRIPLVAFKYNEREIPLITRVKSLQDALNRTVSDFENNLQEDPRNTILVLQNYDGTDLGEFRQNLSVYGAVKVKSIDGAPGDIKTLTTEVNAENYTALINLLKNAMVENAMGYDSKSDKIGNNPNQLVIKSMFSDLDLDVDDVETEFKYSFEIIKMFADRYMASSGYGYFENERAELIFNRDTLINESEAIDNCIKSAQILSEDTVILQHPWVVDAKRETEKKGAEINGQR